ncbi:MAG TPA: hypothetical protein VFU59_00585 [Candidatus Eisenbacteria bacterium]|nr:hypothetical protein [Candidatus Eisenbacteria bacterium]
MPTPTIPLERTFLSRASLALISVALVSLGGPGRAAAQVSAATSFYVPQTGTVAAPTEGTVAIRFFRACPNNDAAGSLPNNARIKVVLRDAANNPMVGVPAPNICVLFNGGTAEQGFSGLGADSIIANGTYNVDPLCPLVTCLSADAATDATGTTYITFTGASPGAPGVGVRDPNRKWGHYDSSLPVYANGVQIVGRLTTASPAGSYDLRIKSFDVVEGLGIGLNEGEAVTTADWSTVAWSIGVSSPLSYWIDFDSSGGVTASDFNLINVHFNHDCDTPNSP